jgi:hypothetical protein
MDWRSERTPIPIRVLDMPVTDRATAQYEHHNSGDVGCLCRSCVIWRGRVIHKALGRAGMVMAPTRQKLHWYGGPWPEGTN